MRPNPSDRVTGRPQARRGRHAGIAIFLCTLFLLHGCDRGSAPQTPAALPTFSAEQVERGRVLAIIGNCAGCHTRRDGEPYAGGHDLHTPFGTVRGGNLTPDPETGIGAWTADDFWRALHEGRGRDGRALVPAFPYTSTTHVPRADSDALFAYLRSLPPVRRANRPHELRFPYGSRLALSAWQWLFFTPADPAATAATPTGLDAAQARGAALVQGLGHCLACHAPRNAFGAPADVPSGGVMPVQGWYAPPLAPAPGRTADEIAALLKRGLTARDAVLGPMAAVVAQSTQHWPDEALRDVAAYLLTLPPPARPAPAPLAEPAVLETGRRLIAERCAECHGRDGEGVPGAVPALAGNATVQQADPRNLLQVLRHGGFAPSTAGNPRPYGMPPQELSEAETAAVMTALRQSWGHQASAVTALDLVKLR